MGGKYRVREKTRGKVEPSNINELAALYIVYTSEDESLLQRV